MVRRPHIIDRIVYHNGAELSNLVGKRFRDISYVAHHGKAFVVSQEHHNLHFRCYGVLQQEGKNKLLNKMLDLLLRPILINLNVE